MSNYVAWLAQSWFHIFSNFGKMQVHVTEDAILVEVHVMQVWPMLIRMLTSAVMQLFLYFLYSGTFVDWLVLPIPSIATVNQKPTPWKYLPEALLVLQPRWLLTNWHSYSKNDAKWSNFSKIFQVFAWGIASCLSSTPCSWFLGWSGCQGEGHCGSPAGSVTSPSWACWRHIPPLGMSAAGETYLNPLFKTFVRDIP